MIGQNSVLNMIVFATYSVLSFKFYFFKYYITITFYVIVIVSLELYNSLVILCQK